jgi:hypothetical protein
MHNCSDDKRHLAAEPALHRSHTQVNGGEAACPRCLVHMYADRHSCCDVSKNGCNQTPKTTLCSLAAVADATQSLILCSPSWLGSAPAMAPTQVQGSRMCTDRHRCSAVNHFACKQHPKPLNAALQLLSTQQQICGRTRAGDTVTHTSSTTHSSV